MTLFIIIMDEKTQGSLYLVEHSDPNSGQLSTVRPIPPCAGRTARSAQPSAAVDLTPSACKVMHMHALACSAHTSWYMM